MMDSPSHPIYTQDMFNHSLPHCESKSGTWNACWLHPITWIFTYKHFFYTQSLLHISASPDKHTIMLEHWRRLRWVSITSLGFPNLLHCLPNPWDWVKQVTFPKAYADGCHRFSYLSLLFSFHPVNWNHPIGPGSAPGPPSHFPREHWTFSWAGDWELSQPRNKRKQPKS